MRIVEAHWETQDAVSLSLARCDGAPFPFQAGQYITLALTVNGEEVRRSYSFSSTPVQNGTATITVKRVADGLVSRHIHATVARGQVVPVLGPFGNFVADPGQAVEEVVLIAGGSGITPVISIAETLLQHQPGRRIKLLYGNRTIEDVIFHRRLAQMGARYPGFSVTHVLETPPDGWTGPVGRLTGERLLQIIPDVRDRVYYICGPAPMMESAAAALGAAGVAPEAIKIERFGSPGRTPGRGAGPTTATVQTDPQVFSVEFLESGRTVRCPSGQTVLRAGLAARVPLAYACEVGECGTCRVRLLSGEVDMDEPNCLLPQEKKAGYILACQARPKSKLVVEG